MNLIKNGQFDVCFIKEIKIHRIDDKLTWALWRGREVSGRI